MSKDTIRIMLLCLAASAAMANARQADPADGWPLQRQHLLAGHYAGKLQSYMRNCQTVRAELWLQMQPQREKSRRYTLKTTCIAGAAQHAPPRTISGSWWMDRVGDSCLTLSFEDPGDPQIGPSLYGFRIEQDPPSGSRPRAAGQVLVQDGHNCHSGSPPEQRDKRLRRVR